MTIVLLLLALATVAAPSQCERQFAPFETGTFSSDSEVKFWRKEEAGAWDGTGWLGWSRGADTLQPVRLVVRDRPKRFPEDEDLVTVESLPEVVWAVRCIPGLRAGKIHNADVVNHNLHPRRHWIFRSESDGTGCTFRRRPRLSPTPRSSWPTADEHRCCTWADGFADDPHFDIEWAGDLDADGKLDLIVNLSRKYRRNPHRLLLSSKASGTQLVGQAAVLIAFDPRGGHRPPVTAIVVERVVLKQFRTLGV